MSTQCHHAILVSGQLPDPLTAAHAEAARIFGPLVSDIVPSGVNGVRTFMVVPDGSGEGWDASNAGDLRRAAFIAYLNSQRHEDASSPYSWVEVAYGDQRGVCDPVANVVNYDGAARRCCAEARAGRLLFDQRSVDKIRVTYNEGEDTPSYVDIVDDVNWLIDEIARNNATYQSELARTYAALRRGLEDSGYCALCEGHHRSRDPACPVAPNVPSEDTEP